MANNRSEDRLSTDPLPTDPTAATSMDEQGEGSLDLHMLSSDQLFRHFHTNATDGLSTDQVAQLLQQHGENLLTPPKKPNYLWVFLSQLFTGFNVFLWIAAIFAFLAWKPFGEPDPQVANLALGVVLCLIIFLNGLLDSYQVIKSIKIVASFANLLPTLTTVRRDGVEQQIVAEKLVPGDVVLVRMGEKLPADLRLVTCDGLKVCSMDKMTNVALTVHLGEQRQSHGRIESDHVYD